MPQRSLLLFSQQSATPSAGSSQQRRFKPLPFPPAHALCRLPKPEQHRTARGANPCELGLCSGRTRARPPTADILCQPLKVFKQHLSCTAKLGHPTIPQPDTGAATALMLASFQHDEGAARALRRCQSSLPSKLLLVAPTVHCSSSVFRGDTPTADTACPHQILHQCSTLVNLLRSALTAHATAWAVCSKPRL